MFIEVTLLRTDLKDAVVPTSDRTVDRGGGWGGQPRGTGTNHRATGSWTYRSYVVSTTQTAMSLLDMIR